jgi:hypothetical protein
MSGRIALVSFLLVLCLPHAALSQSDLLITGVIDGPLSGGVPKAVEFYAPNGIADLSRYAFRSANNGGGTGPPEFTFPAISLDAQTCLWVATESSGFSSFFGFPPTFTNGSASSADVLRDPASLYAWFLRTPHSTPVAIEAFAVPVPLRNAVVSSVLHAG